MKISRLFAIGLSVVAVVAARPAPACRVERFQIVAGLDASGNAVVGQSVTFLAAFEGPLTNPAIGRNAHVGSLRMDYGDGSVADTGVRTFDPPSAYDFGVAAAFSFSHRYAKTGAFTASLKGGSVQPCATAAGMTYRIPVVGNLTAAKHTDPFPQTSSSRQRTNSDGTAKKVVIPIPTPVAYVATGKDTGASHAMAAVIPGRITAAGMSSSPLGTFLTVEGNGRCALKAFETMEGRPLRTYDYKGALPTKITLLNTSPGIHVVRIEGDKSSDSCGGTASASAAVAKR